MRLNSKVCVEPQESVVRIVYASEACIGAGVYAEMERIRASAVRHNVPVGIHTALLYQSGWFVQWKEGPGHALLRLTDRLAADPRHHSLRIVHSSRGPRLLSGPWSMAIVQTNEEPESMARRVARLRQSMENGVQYSPPAVWRQLSTPLGHPGAAQQTNPDAFQRILVCAAAASPSFEFARWLAARHQQPLVRRRFAGDEGLDVGTDYVDFNDDDRVLRVIAMSRKGLAVPLTRAFVPDYSHIVLLLSGEPERDLPLLDKVAAACAGLASPPVLVGVAQHHATHSRPFALAHHLGLIYLDAQAHPHDCAGVWAAVHPLLARWREAANSGPLSIPDLFAMR
ncbi:BLUF domain-containing protein [Polaromonas sp. A23]|uniref:BLUF domain-containing protein n=1 Tax=Polaromonas sp. A23 TaxID=1944133 RepID=UPI0009851466|nr:BLUF domain-containing protein [Polaromonas sp. A23]